MTAAMNTNTTHHIPSGDTQHIEFKEAVFSHVPLSDTEIAVTDRYMLFQDELNYLANQNNQEKP